MPQDPIEENQEPVDQNLQDIINRATDPDTPITDIDAAVFQAVQGGLDIDQALIQTTNEDTFRMLVEEFSQLNPNKEITPRFDQIKQERAQVIESATTPSVDSSASAIDLTVPETRQGPETVFDTSRKPFKYPEREVDTSYDIQDNVTTMFQRGFLQQLISSSGKVNGVNEFVKEQVRKDAQEFESKGLEFSYRNAYRGTMSEMYLDVMRRLKIDVSKINPESRNFINYTVSPEGIREINEGLTVLHYYDVYQGQVPNSVSSRLRFPSGKGILDRDRFIGLTDNQYESMGLLGKVGYNVAVAGSTMADTVFGKGFTAGSKDIVPGVAPVGEVGGFIAGWAVPFSQVNKLFKAKGLLQTGVFTAKVAGKSVTIPRVWAAEAIAGALADIYATAEDDETLANLLQDLPESNLLNNWVSEALAVDIDDNAAVAKLKAAAEGIGFEIGFAPLRKMLVGFKSLRQGKRSDYFQAQEKYVPFSDEARSRIKEIEREIGDIDDEILSVTREADALPSSEVLFKPEGLPERLEYIRTNLGEDLNSMNIDVDDFGNTGIILENGITGRSVDTTQEEAETLVRVLSNMNMVPGDTEALTNAMEITRRSFIDDIENYILTGNPDDLPNVEKWNAVKGQFKEFAEEVFKSSESSIDLIAPLRESINIQAGAAEVRKAELDKELSFLTGKADESLIEQARQELDDVLARAGSPPPKKTDKQIIEESAQEEAGSEQTVQQLMDNFRPAMAGKFEEGGVGDFLQTLDKIKTLEKASKDPKVTFSGPTSKRLKDINKELEAQKAKLLAFDKERLIQGLLGKETEIAIQGGKPSEDILLALELALEENTTRPSLFNETRALLIHDIVREAALSPRKGALVASKIDDNLKIIREGHDMSDKELKDIMANRKRSNLPGIEGVESFSKRGGTPDSLTRRASRVVADVAVDARTNNILYSLGIPALATVSGVLIKTVRTFEDIIGRSAISPFRRASGLLTGTKVKPLPARYNESYLGESLDGMLYTLSGGRVQTQGRPVTTEDILHTILGAFSGSAPSRIDPGIATKSETLLGAGLRSGFNPELGLDPAGLSRLGKMVAGIEDPTMRNVLMPLVSLIEFLPRKALATIDEGLKTADLLNEYMTKIDFYVGRLEDSIGTNPQLADIKEFFEKGDIGFDRLREELKSAVVASIGVKSDALDLEDLIMENVLDRLAISQSRMDNRDEIVRAAQKLGSFPPLSLKESDLEKLSGIEDLIKNSEADILFGRESGEKYIRPIVKQAVEDAQQFARQTTITQDVAQSIEPYVQAVQSSKLGRAISPFTRSIVNVASMTIERVPGLNMLLKKERRALTGALGESEQARSVGKILVGTGLIATGYALADPDRDGVRLEIKKNKTFNRYVVSVPKTKEEFESDLRAGASRYYSNNKEIIERELDRLGIEPNAENSIDYIIDNLPGFEEKDGRVELDFSRLGPFNTLMDLGTFMRDLQEITPFEYIAESEETDDKNPYIEVITQGFGFINDGGYLGPANDFFNMIANPDYAADSYITGWFADATNFGKGLFSTAGEPFQKEFRPNREEDMLAKKTYNQFLLPLFTGDSPENLMKNRDFLGRVLDAPDRAAHLVGKTFDDDLIEHEMFELRLFKRPSRPDSVPKWGGINLKKFKLKSNLSKEQLQLQSDAVVASDGQNAYEDYLIMTGSTNIGGTGSSIFHLQEYFKSKEYRVLKDTIDVLGGDTIKENITQTQIEAAEQAYALIKKDIDKRVRAGRDQAASNLYEISDMYVNEGGETLLEVYSKNANTIQQAQEEVSQSLDGLKMLEEGGR